MFMNKRCATSWGLGLALMGALSFSATMADARRSRRLVRQLTRWCPSFRLTMAVVHGWKGGGAHL